MHRRILSIVLLGGFLTGCTRQEPQAPNAPTPAPASRAVEAAPAEETAPAPTGTATAETAAPTETKPNTGPQEGVTIENFNTYLQGLQRAVDQYIQDQKKKPASLEEIVRAGYLEKIPPVSKGKKYALDAEGQVKEVNQ